MRFLTGDGDFGDEIRSTLAALGFVEIRADKKSLSVTIGSPGACLHHPFLNQTAGDWYTT
jgi:hypothetical protein